MKIEEKIYLTAQDVLLGAVEEGKITAVEKITKTSKEGKPYPAYRITFESGKVIYYRDFVLSDIKKLIRKFQSNDTDDWIGKTLTFKVNEENNFLEVE